MEGTLETLSLTELIRLRERLSEILVSRYERMVAVAHIAGDPPEEPLAARLGAHHGWRVETQGPGVVCCFPTADEAFAAVVELLQAGPDDLRAAIHWCPVLSEGGLTVGDGLALVAEVAGVAERGELRLTGVTYADLSSRFRVRCQPLPPARLAASPRPVELVRVDWRVTATGPTHVRCRESGLDVALPARATFTLGRAAEHDAPDVAFTLPDRAAMQRISRRHLELRREIDGLFVYPLADAVEVDGQAVVRGQRARVGVGALVHVTPAMSLVFHAGTSSDDAGLQTIAVVRSKA